MSNVNDSGYCFSFPAVRGIQAGRPFYIATCPLRTIPKMFIFDEEEVPPELRAQRTLNKSRIPAMAKYLIENPKEYIFSAITVSVGTHVDFKSNGEASAHNIGTLKVPMDAQILINDGQHRRKAIEEALRENPDLGHDNIAVLFFVDEGLTRSQQMFVDLNKYAVKPSSSLSDCYDTRDPSAELARILSKEVKPFSGYTEMEKTNISANSNKLFTLSSIKQATRVLLGKGPKDSYTEHEKSLAIEYWSEVYLNSPQWINTYEQQLSPSEFRQDFVHAHGIGLQALGHLGHTLLTYNKNNWQQLLIKLKNIKWHKNHPPLAKRCISPVGRLVKSAANIILVSNYLKMELNIQLTAEETSQEEKLK